MEIAMAVLKFFRWSNSFSSRTFKSVYVSLFVSYHISIIIISY